MARFLDKYFNKHLDDKEHQTILADFLKPQYDALQAPRMDPEVEEQLSKKGEKILYKLQEQLLEVTGPFTCLLSELIRPKRKTH